MGRACTACNGVGFGAIGPNGFEDTGVPCPTCNASADPKPPGSYAPKPAPKATVAWVDAPGKSGADDRPLSAAEAGFSPAEIARQRAIDLAKERAEREREK
jgi:hypothetical protein